MKKKIPLSLAMQYRKLYNPNLHDEVFGSNNFRIELPLCNPEEDIRFRYVKRALQIFDYPVETQDILKGMTKTKYGRCVRIGKVLSREEARLSRTSIDCIKTWCVSSAMRGLNFITSNPMNQRKHTDFKIVISRHPMDIIKMSTGTTWTSCMTYKHGNFKTYMKHEISGGTLIAWCCPNHKKGIVDPVCRVTIKPFYSKTGERIMIPEHKIYGSEVLGFFDAVVNWTRDNYFDPVDVSHYKIAKWCYTEGDRAIKLNKIGYLCKDFGIQEVMNDKKLFYDCVLTEWKSKDRGVR